MYRNPEGYADPTAGAAIGRITAQERRARRQALRKEKHQKDKKDYKPHKCSREVLNHDS